MGDNRSATRSTATRGVLTVALCAILAASAAGADVVRWVDEDGVTQFTDAQFAPAGSGYERVEVAPANGMVVAQAPTSSRSAEGPTVARLELPPKRNKKGWRSKGESLYTGRRHSSRYQR